METAQATYTKMKAQLHEWALRLAAFEGAKPGAAEAIVERREQLRELRMLQGSASQYLFEQRSATDGAWKPAAPSVHEHWGILAAAVEAMWKSVS